jgi:adenylate cyclase
MKLSPKSLLSLGPVSITACSILLVGGLFKIGTPVLDMLELKTYDLRLRARGPLDPSPAVVLASIDEKSLDALGRWPWPRSKLANLVEQLGQDGARVIGFDIGFLEPDENSELRFLNQVRNEIASLEIRSDRLAGFIEERRARADNDLLLANAIRESPADVVLGYFYHMNQEQLGYQISEERIEQQLERISNSRYPVISFQQPGEAPFVRAFAPESSIPILARAADSCGYYSVKSDPDGVVRWVPLIIQCGEDTYPPLSVAAVWHYLGRPNMVVEVGRYGVEGIRLGAGFIPTSADGQFLINYVGPAKTFRHFPVGDILGGTVPPGTFKDKIVIVGATALGIHDLRTTPFSPLFPGPEIHANIIDNILMQRFLTKPRWSNLADLLAIVLLASATGVVLSHLGPVLATLTVAGLAGAHLLVARHLFVNHGFWINVVYPQLALIGTATGVTVFEYFAEQKERLRIKRTFRQYVPPLVVEEMLKNP